MKPACKDDIRGWFEAGKLRGATHMMVVCDTWDNDDYPVYVMPHEKVKEVFDRYNGPNMQRVMEVYRLDCNMEDQLMAERVFII